MTGQHRLRLTQKAEGPSDRWQFALRQLGASDSEARALWDRQPLDLTVLLDGDRLRRLVEKLDDSSEVVQTASSVQWPACSAHPRMALTGRCPRCEGVACAVCLGAHERCASCARSSSRWRRFKLARVAVLLAVLFVVAASAYTQRARLMSWSSPVEVGVYPIVAVAEPEVEAYVAALDDRIYGPVAAFLAREGARYGVDLAPVVRVTIDKRVTAHPPRPPAAPSTLEVIIWSLRLRYWAWRQTGGDDVDVRLFVLYHPAVKGVSLEHSLGLEQGAIGVVHAFASDAASPTNGVVIAHELLHALGAADKYTPDGQPKYPEGYVDLEQSPLHPQSRAEVMAGRIATSPTTARMPDSLDDCVIGPETAAEIGWAAR